MRFFITIFLSVFLFAGSIDDMLYKVAIKNDLSSKTKKENAGILYVLTRTDIDSLQITHLKDVLKILPSGYKVSRFGIVDIFNSNTNIPFLSSGIKVFINDQEITSGLFNSGLVVLGDVDLGWVDHIEVYTQSPSFDISTEPSVIVIKLYSKTAKRDEGVNLHFSYGTKATSYDYLTFAKSSQLSFFTYGAYDKDSSFYRNGKIRKHFLFSLYDDKQSLLVDTIFLNRDGLFGFSSDGNLDKSYLKNSSVHIGYKREIGNFEVYAGFQYMNLHSFYEEEPVLFVYNDTNFTTSDVETRDYLADLNFKYKKEFKNNILIVGVKNRIKYLQVPVFKFDNDDIPRSGRDRQLIHSFYFQDSYFLKKNSVLNFGYEYAHFVNNGGFADQKTNLIRAGHTYVKEKWTFKTNYSHTEYVASPYLISSIYSGEKILKTIKVDNIFENIKYNLSFQNNFDILIGYFRAKNYWIPNENGLLYSYGKYIHYKYFDFRWDYRYKPFSKFSFNYYFHDMTNLSNAENKEVHKLVLTNYHKNRKFSFFEELVVDKENVTKFYYDLSAGMNYDANENLSFFLKGQNLLNRAYEYEYFSYDPVNNKFNPPKSVPMVEKKVVAGMEYTF